MKQLITKSFFMLVFFASVFNLDGCAVLLYDISNTQDIIIEAEDGGVYDFYVNNSIVCSQTDRCIYPHYKNSICQYTIDAKRGEEVYGTLFYGYWEERSTFAKMMSKRDDNKCPEGWKGASAIVEIDPDVKRRVESAERKVRQKKADAQWMSSPLSSGSAE